MKMKFLRFILLIFFALLFLSHTLFSQRAHTGLWLENRNPSYMEMDMSWDTFIQKHERISYYGLQLTDIETDIQNGKRVFTAIWLMEELADDTTIVVNSPSYETFYNTWESLTEQNLRLIDVETYLDGKQRKYLGIYRRGHDPHFFTGNMDWKQINAEWVQRFPRDMRMIDMEVFFEDGDYKFLGIWRYGTKGQLFWGGTDWSGFATKMDELASKGLNIIDFETYHDGSSLKYIGIWSQDSIKQYIWNGVDKESFEAKWQQLRGRRYILADFEQYAGCKEGCDNQIVSNQSFELKLRGHSETYQQPIRNVRGTPYVDLSAINFSGQMLYLPFTDGKPVELTKTWTERGKWNYGLTYELPSQNSFRVRAMAEGTVIYANWEPFYGNTIVISHDYRGQKDAFRTIYTNLQNGASADCERSWKYSAEKLQGAEKRAYEQYLKASGCPANTKKQNLSEVQWGTEKNLIPRLRGKKVKLGEFLGWAGSTGPLAIADRGTKTEPHLQVFVARRRKNTQNWYLIDPYGIYAERTCYPNRINQLSTLPCSYAKAWKHGRPQFPTLRGVN